MMQLGFAFPDASGHGGRGSGLGRAAQGDVPLAGQQARGRIETDPPRPWQIDLAPGVEIGEVHLGPARSIQRLLVGRQLDEVPAHETGGHPHRAEELDQQPGRIAAGTAAQGQRLLGRLDSGLEPDQVPDGPLQVLVQPHDEIDGPNRASGAAAPGASPTGLQIGHQRVEAGAGCGTDEEGFQVLGQRRPIFEGVVDGRVLEEEVEGVVDGHLRDQLDLDLELAHRFREHDAGIPVREGVLLPMQEMLATGDPLGIAEDRSPAMRGRPQSDHMGSVGDGLVVGIVRDMPQGDVNGHG